VKNIKHKKLIFIGKDDYYSKKIYKFIIKNFNSTKIFLLKNKLENKKFKQNFKFSGDYLISYRNPIILTKKILDKIQYPINFHPSTPKYRGVGCYNRAILNRDKIYGSTIHLINSKIDKGKILVVERFRISKVENLETLIKKTHKLQYGQIINILKMIKSGNFDIKKFKNNYKWSGNLFKKKQLEKIYEIKKKTSKNSFNRLILATNTKKFKPYIKIYNKKFYYED
tara:strand:- start:115 stop:792 length:678 start_codon:yes stop_codon:yes gene_type:complete